ncbi:ATPase [Cellvibrio mixtus]|jgi:glucosamine kinase|uniref:ATPase n=1 Tax=Cellvibrio mixtus TaxID=39650 RepID=A0A266Q8Y5_9GAMM|nr:BadF/BadG/BcrA/BcrD ATPase family protein [Cellvibrio mixtus]OZY86344.1 ATPase [Cellvibrio mixtus]
MVKMPLGEQTLYIGIDGGGTKCRASIMTEDLQVLGTGVGGPANPFHGVQQAKDSIRTAAELALIDAGLPPATMGQLIAGAGLAGVNVPSLYDVMSDWQHPFKQMFLTTDLHIACLGAHNRDEGAVMIAGTGSCGYSYVNNASLFLGGHGFPIGDKGSGAWMGLEAIQAVLLDSDNLGPATMLSHSISHFLQAEGVMIVDKMFGAKSSDYAKFAIFVVDAADAGDEVAISIVKEGAAYMSAVARRLWATQPGRMSIIGGLAPRLIPWMDKDMADNLSPALYQPEFGAVYFAKQQSKR